MRILSYLSSKDGFHFIHVRKRNFSQTFQKVNATSIVGQQTSSKDECHFIHVRGTLLNRNPKVAYFSTIFSESESFHTGIVGQLSSFMEESHFIHGREAHYKREPSSCIVQHSLFRKLNFSFHKRTLGYQSSLKDWCHFIHVRGTPL